MQAAVLPLVEKLGGSVETVNVDGDPALLARWGDEVPVLLDSGGRVVAKGRDGAGRIAKRLGA